MVKRPTPDDLARAAEIEKTFSLTKGIYVLGSFERGVTVYNQQVRAHNLVWALWEIANFSGDLRQRIAIVGGGIAGLTAAAASMSLFREAQITIFEKRWDLCPLQQGSDTRWLHPHIYEWPEYGSRAPSASLPVLNWKEGRASDVAREVLRGFTAYCERYSRDSLRVYLGLKHLQVTSTTNNIEWIGSRAAGYGPFHVTEAEGANESFDIIILASGFGLEDESFKEITPSYWRNEQFGQPILTGSKRPYLVSGFGDGALIDICRLAIEGFRQDTILYELFGDELEEVERRLRANRSALSIGTFNYLLSIESSVLASAKARLRKRLRKDTNLTVHFSGPDGSNNSLTAVFDAASSFQNRMLLFMLYRCGVFGVRFGPLETAITECGASRESIICRYGSDVMKHVLGLFADPDNIVSPAANLKKMQAQIGSRLWIPGTFPPP